MNPIRLIIAGIILTLFTLSSGARQSDEQFIAEAARSAVITTSTRSAAEVVASDIRINGIWATGVVVTRVPEGVHGTPDLRLFVAQKSGENWQIALEWTPDFTAWLMQTPADLMPLGQRLNLTQATNNTRGNGDSRLSLPFTENESWMLAGGPHGNGGDGYRPWSSLDLALGNLTPGGEVRAAREGYVHRTSSCPNYIRIDHADGWETGYYHLKNEQVNNGDYVQRGQLIGYTSNNVGCGGWSSGPHVHFSLRRHGVYLNIAGHDVGGWTVYEGNAHYEGCFQRVRDEYWRCRGTYIYNDGSVGSGYADKRYDYNQDGKPDLWAVNMRDTVTNSSAVKIASGKNLTAELITTRSGMPQQPEFLNTAFAAGDYDGDGYSDLWVIHRLDGSETTALRVMGGMENFSYLYLDTETALPPYDNSVSFAVADYNRDSYPDLWAIIPRDGARNAVSVKIVAGPEFQTVLADSATSLPPLSAYSDMNFAAADYDNDGTPDLWAINPRRTKSQSVGVNVISGKDWQTSLINTGTPFRMMPTNINRYGFVVADYNKDAYPDVWWVDRKKLTVRIVSGQDFTTLLYSGASSLPKTNQPNWHILGSDRARESIPPDVALLREPVEGFVVNSPNMTFTWDAAGLASSYVLTLRDAATGGVVAQRNLGDGWKICKTEVCTSSTQALGILLRDNRIYTWNVSTSNAYGVTGGQTRVFATEIPGAPVLQQPANGAVIDYNTTVSVPLTWAVRPDADFYKILVRNPVTGYVFRTKVQSLSCDPITCTFALPGPLVPGDYKWQVKSRNIAVNGTSKSEKWTFSVIDQPVTR